MHCRLLLICLAGGLHAGSVTAAPGPAASPAFRHLEVHDGSIHTAAPLPYRIGTDGDLRAGPATRREAVFGGHPFEVSMAALVGSDAVVMVHAERVADGSGRSNYDALPPSQWPEGGFRVRRQCAVIDRETARGEHDLAYLAAQGMDPEGVLALEQYYATTPDHNREVVISLVARVARCDAEADNAAALARLRNRVRVERAR